MSSLNNIISLIAISSLFGGLQTNSSRSTSNRSTDLLSQFFAPQQTNNNDMFSILAFMLAFSQTTSKSSGLPDIASLLKPNTSTSSTAATTTTTAATGTAATTTAATTGTTAATGTAATTAATTKPVTANGITYNGTITLDGKKGILPAGYSKTNLPATIIYNGVTYAKNPKAGASWAYKATTQQPMGFNFLNLGLTKKSGTNSSSSGISGSPGYSGSPSSSDVWEYNIGTTSPLVLDLDGNGSTEAIADKQNFDINADGILDTINKINTKDGILAFDADHDGRIGEDGKELFGNHTLGQEFANGFEALKAVAEKLLGQAAVADGKLDASEIKKLEAEIKLSIKLGDTVKSLTDLKINELSLNFGHSNGHVDQFGNLMGEDGSFIINGKQQKIVDVYFNR